MKPWEDLIEYDNPNEQLSLFYKFYNEILDKHCPYVVKTLRKNKKCPLNPNTKLAMKTRDKLKNELKDLQGSERVIKLKQFRRERNRVISMVRKDEQEYFAKLISEEGNNNPWKPINEILKVKKDASIPIMEKSGLVTCDLRKANLLNQAFIDKIKRIKCAIKCDNIDPCINLKKADLGNCQFNFKSVKEKTIRKKIKELKNTKSSGLDGVQTNFLKKCLDELSVPLTLIVNSSLITGIYPEVLKTALITPLYKKGSKSLPENYRPIAGLSIISKILEGVAQDQLRAYFETRNFFPKSQHGYRSNRSTSSAVLQLTNYLCQEKERGRYIGTSFIDLTSAYDCVEHEILLKKLQLYGLSINARNWIESFLKERHQVVRVNDKVSDKLPVHWGVPQGSCLSPLLYLIYTADIDSYFPESELSGYADDYGVSIAGASPEKIIAKLEAVLWNFKNYFCRLGLSMNSEKTEFLMVRPKRDPNEYKIKVNGSSINESVSVKVLGVHVMNNLCWTKHIDSVCQTISQRTGLINRLKFKLNTEHLTNITHGIILSHVKYCLSSFATIRIEDQDSRSTGAERIQVLLNNVARIINRVKRTDHVSKKELFEMSPWLSVNHMCITSVVADTWKALNDKSLMNYYNRDYKINTRAASQAALKMNEMCCSAFVRNGVLLINNPLFEGIEDFTNSKQVKKHVKKLVTKFPL